MSGCAFTLGSAAIAWSSKEQPTVALSSTEAEYRGAVVATCEAIWLKRLLKDLHEEVSDSTVIYSNNLSSIQLAKNPVFHARTKHIEVHYHSVRERVLSGEVELQRVPTDRQTADIFTKPLGLERLRQFSDALGLRHLDLPKFRGRDDQEGRKARKEQEEEVRDVESNAESTEWRKEAEPDAVDPNSEEANDSESESRSERAEERRCDSETLNQPRPKWTRRTQRMRPRCNSREAEKGRCRPGGSMLHKQQTEEHVRGHPKDHTSNIQTEFRVLTGRRRSGESYGIPCDGGKSPKTRKHENPCDCGKSPKARKYGIPCGG
jgi:hypothetical protein